MNTDKTTTTASVRPDNVRLEEWRQWLKANDTNGMVWPFNMWMNRATREDLEALLKSIVADVASATMMRTTRDA